MSIRKKSIVGAGRGPQPARPSVVQRDDSEDDKWGDGDDAGERSEASGRREERGVRSDEDEDADGDGGGGAAVVSRQVSKQSSRSSGRRTADSGSASPSGSDEDGDADGGGGGALSERGVSGSARARGPPSAELIKIAKRCLDTDNQTPVLANVFTKSSKDDSKWIRFRWRPRYVVVGMGNFAWYAHEGDTHAKGIRGLECLQRVEKLEPADIGGKRNAFEVRT
jgi:hypothetical protein